MTNPDPLNQKDLDLVAAFAAGMLDEVDANQAQQLIASDTRFADEHAAQLLAISALGNDDWYRPLNDIEKARLRTTAVPKAVSKRPVWSIRILKPLSIAAVAVVIVGFAGMTLFGGSADMEFATDRVSDGAEQSVVAATDAPALEAPAPADVLPQSDDASTAIEEGALVPKFGFPTSPPEGELEALRVEMAGSLEEFLNFQQWTDPVELSRYRNLACWPDAADFTEVLGVSLSTVAGIEYEIVRTPDTVEARTVEGCEPSMLIP
jgi:hypothetical protein